jgi:hypothetical protein
MAISLYQKIDEIMDGLVARWVPDSHNGWLSDSAPRSLLTKEYPSFAVCHFPVVLA